VAVLSHLVPRARASTASGRKAANAKFIRVVFKGLPCRRTWKSMAERAPPLEIPEAAANPIMLAATTGQWWFRNIYWRALRPIIER